MARIPRMVITGEPTVYHIISRTALDGLVLGDVERDYLLELIRHLSSIYFKFVYEKVGYLPIRVPASVLAYSIRRERKALYWVSGTDSVTGPATSQTVPSLAQRVSSPAVI